MHALEAHARRASDGLTSPGNEYTSSERSPDTLSNPPTPTGEKDIERNTSSLVLLVADKGVLVVHGMKLRCLLLTDYESAPIWYKIYPLYEYQEQLRKVVKANVTELLEPFLAKRVE